jgi:DNA polymerase-3 subunit gamma/tau
VSPQEPVGSPAPASAPAAGALTLVDVRRLWPDIVEATKLRRRVAWMHLSQNCQVISVEGDVLTLGFVNAGARDSFVGGGCDEVLRQAAIDVVGADWKIDTIVDPGAQAPGPVVTKAATTPSAPAAPADPAPAPARTEVDAPPAWAADDPTDDAGGTPAPEPPATPAAPTEPAADPQAIAAAREAIQQTREAGATRAPAGPGNDADADAHPDDLDADSADLGTDALLSRELGAQVIEEIRHQ